MANKDQNEKMCVSHLGSNDDTDPADVSELTIRHTMIDLQCIGVQYKVAYCN